MNLDTGKNNVYIPYYRSIAHALPAAVINDMTLANTFFNLLGLIALINSRNRPRILLPAPPKEETDETEENSGQNERQMEVPIALFSDLNETLELVENVSDLRPYVLNWFQTIFLPAHEEIVKENLRRYNALDEDDKKKQKRDFSAGITTKELASWIKQNKSRSMAIKQIRESYLEPLYNSEYLDKEDNPDDKRQSIYSPVIDKKEGGGIKSFMDDGHANQAKKVRIKDPKSYPNEQNMVAWINEDGVPSGSNGDAGKIAVMDPAEGMIAMSPEDFVRKLYSDQSTYFRFID